MTSPESKETAGSEGSSRYTVKDLWQDSFPECDTIEGLDNQTIGIWSEEDGNEPKIVYVLIRWFDGVFGMYDPDTKNFRQPGKFKGFLPLDAGFVATRTLTGKKISYHQFWVST